jgi:hypothetical protein
MAKFCSSEMPLGTAATKDFEGLFDGSGWLYV